MRKNEQRVSASQQRREDVPSPVLGQRLELQVERVAHGGICIAHAAGKAVFVRGTAPGEIVIAQVQEDRKRFMRASTLAVLQANPERRDTPCPIASQCGGCDFQYLNPAYQRELKAQVLREQLQRLAHIEWEGEVLAVNPDDLGWRSRMRYQVDDAGQVGFYGYRSHDVVPLPPQGCLIAHPQLREVSREYVRAGKRGRDRNAEISVQCGELSNDGRVMLRKVGERRFRVAQSGFWQSHIAAPEVLTNAVVDMLQPSPGERIADLYCGVGIFAAALVDAGAEVWGVEGDRAAMAFFGENVPTARGIFGDVFANLQKIPDPLHVVVLDPPRVGAGIAAMRAICAKTQRAICYISCDPASLARDLGVALECGFQISEIRAFDLFPNTHHVETVVKLTRTS